MVTGWFFSPSCSPNFFAPPVYHSSTPILFRMLHSIIFTAVLACTTVFAAPAVNTDPNATVDGM